MRRDFRPDDYSQKHLAYQKYYGLQQPHHLPTANSPHPLLQPGNVPTARNKLSNGCFCKKCHRTQIVYKDILHLKSFIYKNGTSTTYPLHKRLQCFILSNGCFCKKCHRTWIIRKGRLHLMSFIYKYGTSTTYPLHKRLQCFILMTFVSTIRILCNLPLRAIWVRPKILIQELPRFLKPHSHP